MTPTEQDKELQKAVWASLASQMTHAINCTDPEHTKQNSCVDFTEKNFDQLMHLITADRKRVALEARIDEIKLAKDNSEVLSVLDELEKEAYLEFAEMPQSRVVPLSAIQTLKERYK